MTSDEDAFLRKILENPADDVTRLVYADWLQERDELAKCEFLRLTVEIESAKKGRRKTIGKRMQELGGTLDLHWSSIVSKVRIENCNAGGTSVSRLVPILAEKPEFQCPKQWESLNTTDNVTIRHCTSCQKSVHYCDTLQVAREHVAAGNCIALDLGVIRRHDDLHPKRFWLGRPSAETLAAEEARMKLDPVSETREKAKKERGDA